MYDNFNNDILGKRIRAIREKRQEQYKNSEESDDSPYKKYKFCKSQNSLAKKIGVERRAIIGWESGTNAPSVRNLVKLSDALDCGIDYFLGAIDYMDISPISLSAHFSGISPDIINYGLENPDYLECLNFFMHPDNCKTLFNNVTISAWRKYWINAGLPKIKEPFKSEVYKAYDEYSAITPISKVNKNSYTEFLKMRFPEKKLVFKKEERKKGYILKGSFEFPDYQSFFENKQFKYNSFIKFLADTTFEPLSHNALIEAQKMNLAKFFCNLFTRYLEQDLSE